MKRGRPHESNFCERGAYDASCVTIDETSRSQSASVWESLLLVSDGDLNWILGPSAVVLFRSKHTLWDEERDVDVNNKHTHTPLNTPMENYFSRTRGIGPIIWCECELF